MTGLPTPSRHGRPTRVLSARASSPSSVDIPSSTIISIGLGFVGFALSALSLLVLLRVFKTRQHIRRERRNGNNDITFRQHWRAQGGFFGFLTNSGTDAFGHGGGGIMDSDIDRIRRMLEEREWRAKGYLTAPTRPVMWECEVPQKEKLAEHAVPPADLRPMSLLSSPPPPYADRAKSQDQLPAPRLGFSILIKLPSPIVAVPRNRLSREEDEEEYDELPDLVIGQAIASPYIGLVDEADRRESLQSDSSSIASKDKLAEPGIGGGDTLPVVGRTTGAPEVAVLAGRPAKWEKADGAKWRIEGLDLG